MYSICICAHGMEVLYSHVLYCIRVYVLLCQWQYSVSFTIDLQYGIISDDISYFTQLVDCVYFTYDFFNIYYVNSVFPWEIVHQPSHFSKFKTGLRILVYNNCFYEYIFIFLYVPKRPKERLRTDNCYLIVLLVLNCISFVCFLYATYRLTPPLFVKALFYLLTRKMCCPKAKVEKVISLKFIISKWLYKMTLLYGNLNKLHCSICSRYVAGINVGR